MSLLGIHLTLLAGPTVPAPLAPHLLESLQSVEVTHTDEGRSGFQLVFQAGRSSADPLDYSIASSPQLRAHNRVILMVTFGARPVVLMDGLITNHQLATGDAPGSGTFTITGEDVSIAMDRHERTVEHPAMSESVIALRIIAEYAKYGLVPTVIPPPSLDAPVPSDRIPVQQGTDLQHLLEIARRFNYVFYIQPGPAPGMNIAYWGPPVRRGVPQRALSYNLGSATNIKKLDFVHDAIAPTRIEGQVQDRTSNRSLPISAIAPSSPPLAALPADPTAMGTRQFRESGLAASQAFARAQGTLDASMNNVVRVNGELDSLVYGEPLNARGLVGLRGAGYLHDGLYYVKSVTHSISRSAYAQKFSLVREGLGATIGAVRT